MVKAKKIFAQTYIWLILLLMYLPVLVLIVFSFTTAKQVGQWSGFSFGLYKNLLSSKEIWIAVGNTLIIAFTSALVSTVLGSLGAIGSFYSKKKTQAAFDNVTQIPIVNAEIVMALSLCVMFTFLGTYLFRKEIASYWTLLIGHVVLSIPFVYISVKPKLQQMDPSVYEAALDLGATPMQALRKVIVPEIMPGVMSGFLLAITLSLDDFVITQFTRGTGLLSGESDIETISTYVQSHIAKRPVPPELRALTTIIFLIVVIAVVIISIRNYRLSKQAKVRKGRED